MHRYSYYKTAACTPNVSIGDPQANKEEILKCIQELDSDTQLVVFPELCITGYTCQDLFYEHTLLNKAKQVLFEIVEELPENIVAVLGLPLEIDNKLYNCAAICFNHDILGIDRAKCAMIVTEYPKEICEALSKTFGSGVTRVDATGGYSKRSKSIVYFVVNRYQVNRMKEQVHDIDAGAYIIMSEVADIFSNNMDKV